MAQKHDLIKSLIKNLQKSKLFMHVLLATKQTKPNKSSYQKLTVYYQNENKKSTKLNNCV